MFKSVQQSIRETLRFQPKPNSIIYSLVMAAALAFVTMAFVMISYIGVSVVSKTLLPNNLRSISNVAIIADTHTNIDRFSIQVDKSDFSCTEAATNHLVCDMTYAQQEVHWEVTQAATEDQTRQCTATVNNALVPCNISNNNTQPRPSPAISIESDMGLTYDEFTNLAYSTTNARRSDFSETEWIRMNTVLAIVIGVGALVLAFRWSRVSAEKPAKPFVNVQLLRTIYSGGIAFVGFYAARWIGMITLFMLNIVD